MILQEVRKFSSLIPTYFDKEEVTSFAGFLNDEPATTDYEKPVGTVIETLTVAYDADDNPITVTNLAGEVWTITYDELQRYVSKVLT